jgi:diguanylate cyclase (GGDEF)-like protein/PAS domain S-box-containing protein
MRKFARLIILLTLLPTFAATAAERVVRVGVYENPPKLMQGKDGLPSGILGDLLKEIAQAERWKISTVPCEWEDCLSAVKEGRIDLMPDVAYTDSRDINLDFHQIPALHSWSQIYRRQDVEIESMLDLAGKRIAILDSSIQEEYLTALLAGFNIRSELIPVDSFEQGFRLVADGGADVIAVNHHFGAFYGGDYDVAASHLMFQPSTLFYVTAKGKNAALLAAIDDRLMTWKNQQDSPYFKVLEHWGTPYPEPLVPRTFWWGLTGLLAALLLASGFVILLRKEVQKRTAELRLSEDKMKTILNSVDAYIYIKDKDLRYQYVNQKVCDMTGHSCEEILGLRDDELFDSKTAAELHESDLEILKTGKRQVREEISRSLNNHQEKIFLTSKIPLIAADNTIYGLCGISTDITEQRQFIEEIHQLAFFDSLTHLPNRRQLIQELEKMLECQQPLAGGAALLFINLDNFKEFNDTHGYGAGDQLLRQVAQRLQNLASSNDFLARLGSDEFAFICRTGCHELARVQRHIENIANHIMSIIADEEYMIGSLRYRASACVGIALLSHQQLTVEAAMKHADLALYEAKSNGRNKVSSFQPDMEAVMTARTILELELRQAIEQEQFVLHYQPQVDADQHLLGYEALVRWQHPQRGLVPPNSFIGLAEVTGLIEPLGDWILRTACSQIKTWGLKPETSQLVLSVNISAHQLHHPEFVEHVVGILLETGANPERLELELTESQLISDVESTLAKMKALKVYGIRLSIDDFGTGYSSLNYLKRFPLDQLKIDQSFIRDLAIDPNDMFIVKAIIEMGQSLNLSVLAEGVETEAQREALLKLGCFQFQGHLFGKPAAIKVTH